MAYLGAGDAFDRPNDPRIRSLGDDPVATTNPTTGNTQWVADTASLSNSFATIWNSITGHAPPQATLPPMQVDTGPSMTTIALIGGVAILGIVLLKKRKR